MMNTVHRDELEKILRNLWNKDNEAITKFKEQLLYELEYTHSLLMRTQEPHKIYFLQGYGTALEQIISIIQHNIEGGKSNVM